MYDCFKCGIEKMCEIVGETSSSNHVSGGFIDPYSSGDMPWNIAQNRNMF